MKATKMCRIVSEEVGGRCVSYLAIGDTKLEVGSITFAAIGADDELLEAWGKLLAGHAERLVRAYAATMGVEVQRVLVTEPHESN